jgi:hypothetical protein
MKMQKYLQSVHLTFVCIDASMFVSTTMQVAQDPLIYGVFHDAFFNAAILIRVQILKIENFIRFAHAPNSKTSAGAAMDSNCYASGTRAYLIHLRVAPL